MLKRILCLLLALMLPCAALADYVMAGYDAENTYRDWNKNLFFQRMEERTGIHFTYRQYTKLEDWTRAKQSMQAGTADLPDVLFKAQLSPSECIDLLDRGVLIDLKPYLAEYCPSLSAILAAHPDYLEAITLPDGRIAALPNISEQPMQNCVWLNQDWLSALRLPMPATVEELTDTLRAFRDGDPNRNGKKDEIPLAFIGAFDLKFLGHAFGLIANDYNLRAVDGQAQFVPLDARFRPFVEWLRLLYSEKLIDPSGFSTADTLRQITDENKTNVYGGAITPMMNNFLPTSWLKSYVALPPIAYEGQAVYRSFLGAVIDGAFAVTSACQNVPEVLGWVDSFYTEEVYILASAGQENVDYVVDGDGTWRMTNSATDNTYFSGDVLISSGTAIPGLATEAFQRRYSDPTVSFVADQLALVNAAAQRPFPYYALTAEQEAYIAPLQSRLGRLVDESIARWVNGETEISDQSFAVFEQALQAAGLTEFMQFWQAVLDGRNAQ